MPRTHTPDVREQVRLIEKGVAQKEPRFINRALRSLTSLRKKTNNSVLRRLVMTYYPTGELSVKFSLMHVLERQEIVLGCVI